MFAGQPTDHHVQASIDAVIDAARAGQKPSDADMETLGGPWEDMAGGEWCADLVSLDAFRQSYEEGFLHEEPVDLTVLADNAIVALVRRLAPMAFQQADPDDSRLCCHPITHSDGEQWVLCSFYSLELVPIGVFETTEDAKAACVAMGYLVGNDGDDARHLASMPDDLLVHHVRMAADERRPAA
jgi:hypothetical protein